MSDPAPQKFEPFVPASTTMAEFTPKAIILGIVFGLIFGAATVYLALTAGLTVSASIPIAVLAIAVFRRFGKATILENNMVQTIGSAGESIAAGVVFTIPALIFLTNGEQYFNNIWNIFALSIIGGLLGVLFMVPLRRALIVKEHGSLPYPEGTACADVLVAGEKGGSLAKMVFAGLGMAALYRIPMSILGLWKETPTWSAARDSAYPRATVNCDVTPEYLGVGYIIGPKIAGVLVAGGVLGYLVMIPLISLFGDGLTSPLAPGVKLISEMSFNEVRVNYVRYIGAGAVAAAGFITLLKTLPTIVSAFKESFASLKDLKAGVSQSRTERDIPITWVLGGSAVLVAIVAALPQLPSSGVMSRVLMGLLVVVFGFFFVTVSSRIVGIIGTSSNPVSGMTIATLMGTCLLFVSLGWTGDAYQAIALCVGGMVCIAASNAGNTSQDLKTGYLVGATPRAQQYGLMIGVATSALAVGWTLRLIDNAQVSDPIVPGHAIGSTDYPAPQANLMATIIRGLLAQDLPWGFVFAGMAIAVVIELCGVKSLSFAVGLYLPLSTTMPIFIGGALRGLMDRKSGHKGGEEEISSGMLYATGLVAGGALTGVLIAGLQGWRTGPGRSMANDILDAIGVHGWERFGRTADVIGIAMFAILCFFLVRAAKKKLEA